MKEVYSVEELTQYIKFKLEDDSGLQDISVSGEISNLTYHRSGHVYFAIKDTKSQLSCVMFKTYAQHATRMKEGDHVTLSGSINVYVPRGYYQLVVRSIKQEGVGTLYIRFLQLKEQLQAAGLFDPIHKKSLPIFPKKIAVITSPTGAAVRDILRTLYRRFPHVHIVVIPTVVQGVHGKDSIIGSLVTAQGIRADLIILARGGGSIEDLWNFNEEGVARAIFHSSIPVISGIGHETDFTIADFVADVRASTPTAAAEQSVPEVSLIIEGLAQAKANLRHQLQHFINYKRQSLDDLSFRLNQYMKEWINQRRQTLNILAAKLESMDLTAILKQGYSITTYNGKVIRNANEIKEGDEINTILSNGQIESEIKRLT